jgi:hypothetical protein
LARCAAICAVSRIARAATKIPHTSGLIVVQLYFSVELAAIFVSAAIPQSFLAVSDRIRRDSDSGIGIAQSERGTLD